MAERNRKKECPQLPVWMLTFSDLMSLLLTFFVLLYAMSALNIQTFSKWLSFFQGGGNILPPASVIPPPIPVRIGKLALKAQKVLAQIDGYSAFQVIVSRNEIIIQFPYGVNFDMGDYHLREPFKKALARLVPILNSIKGKYKVEVQGFTSPLEKPKYPWIKDNWILSAKRATEVVRYLIAKGFDRKKLVAEAYDSLKPVYTGSNKELESKNARVELHIRFYTENYLKGNPSEKPIKKIVPIPELEELFKSSK